MKKLAFDQILLGFWLQQDHQNLNERILLEFEENGKLTYSILLDDKVQKIFLQYVVEGVNIVTNQSSSPNVEHTRFAIVDDCLTLYYSEKSNTFSKITADDVRLLLR